MSENQLESPEDRRERYLQSAIDAQEVAMSCSSAATRDTYMRLARSWRMLAEHVGSGVTEGH